MMNRRNMNALLVSTVAFQGHADEVSLRGLVFDVRPYGFADGAGALRGILVEWFRELAREAKVDIRVELAPLARVVRDFDQRQGDLTVLIASPMFVPTTVGRAVDVGSISLGVWTPSASPVKCIADLEGKRVAVLRGGSAEYLARGWSGVDVVPVGSVGSMVTMLRIGRVDALFILEPTLRAHLDRQPDVKFQEGMHRAFESSWPMSLFVSQRVSRDAQARIARAVDALRKMRRFEALSAAYAIGKR